MVQDHSGRKEGNVLFNDALNTFYLRFLWRQTYGKGPFSKEGNVLFNDGLNTFYLLYNGVRHMVKDHSVRKEMFYLRRTQHILFTVFMASDIIMIKDHSDSERAKPAAATTWATLSN